MRKRKFYKQFRRSLNDYKEFFISEEGNEVYSEENYVEGDLNYVCLYDSFDNSGIRKLIKNIYSLNKKQYEIKYTSYIYSRKGQYLKFQNLSSSHGIFSEVKVLNNKFIKQINMSWCQRSNYTAILEYKLEFNHSFKSFKSEFDFIVNTLEKVNRKKIDYYKSFDLNSKSFKHESNDYLEYHNDLFKYAIQKYIENTFYQSVEKKYDLMTLYVYSVKNLKMDNLRPPYMGLIGRHKESKAAFFLDRTPSTFEPIFDVEVITSGKYFDNRSIMTFFSKYRNIIYYNLYFDQELNILNNKISGYNLEAKKIYNFKNLMWMYRKIAELESSRDSGESIDVDELNKMFNDNWVVEYGTYEGDNQVSLPYNYEFSRSKIEFILQKYREQYELYKVALEAQTSKYNTTIAFVSLGLAILSIIFAIGFGLA